MTANNKIASVALDQIALKQQQKEIDLAVCKQKPATPATRTIARLFKFIYLLSN